MDANSRGQFEEQVICRLLRVCPTDYLLVARGKKISNYTVEKPDNILTQ